MTLIDPTQIVAPKGYAPSTAQVAYGEAWRKLSGGPPVLDSPDLHRIAALPRRPQEVDDSDRAEALIDAETERYSRHPQPAQCKCSELDPERHAAEGCMTRLRLAQAWSLREIRIVGGLFGPIGVGHGKTLLDILAALALAVHGCRTVLLLVPPGLIDQLIGDYEYAAQHFMVPSIEVTGGRYAVRVPGMPLLTVLPYSKLSRPEATTWLERNLRPDAIVSDEVHKLGALDGAGASRVNRYMEDHTTTRFCGWSGTVTKKKLAEYQHLIKWALRMGSPLPLNPIVSDDWGRTIDAGCSADPGALLEMLQQTGCISPGEHVRDGFRRRLVETLGVVSTQSPAVTTELRIDERYPIYAGKEIHCIDDPDECSGPDGEIPQDEGLPQVVRKALADLRETWTRPDGEELLDALQMAKCARELACGFYYQWIFPHNKLPDDEELILRWLNRRRDYHREARKKLKARDEHLDSPMLVEHAAQRYWGDRPQHKGLPVWKCDSWPAWRDVKNLVHPETQAVRVHDFLARDALAWARKYTGIVWYDHGEFGRWVSELSAKDGGPPLPVFGGGKPVAKLLKAEHGDRSVLCSIAAHGTGRNGLQHVFWRQLIEHIPSTGAEQLLGRLHRVGQPRPCVETWYYAHTVEMLRQLEDALVSDSYVEGTLGAAQKLRSAIEE